MQFLSSLNRLKSTESVRWKSFVLCKHGCIKYVIFWKRKCFAPHLLWSFPSVSIQHQQSSPWVDVSWSPTHKEISFKLYSFLVFLKNTMWDKTEQHVIMLDSEHTLHINYQATPLTCWYMECGQQTNINWLKLSQAEKWHQSNSGISCQTSSKIRNQGLLVGNFSEQVMTVWW